jgi:polyisoprenoid-binding protein YceI
MIMRHLVFGLLAFGIAAMHAGAARAADAPEWTVDAGKSSITFTGRQMGVPSTGKFRTFTARVQFEPTNLEAGKVEVIIDMASADGGNPDIDKELRQPKWFDVAKFPNGRFIATSFKSKGGNAYEALGKLTLRDVTQDVVLPFRLDIRPEGDQLVARATGELTVSRLKFGIGSDEWRDTKIVGDEVTIRIDVLARRKK